MLFSRKSEPLFKQLRLTIIFLIIYSGVVIAAQEYYYDFFEKIQANNLSQFHLIFSFVLSILIAFRVNSSYSRWWEARGYWGAFVNNSRNLALKFNNYIGLKHNPQFLAYLTALPVLIKYHLQQDGKPSEQILLNLGIKFTAQDHLPTLLIHEMYRILNTYREQETLRFEQYMALDQHLVNIVDLLGGCEKIANTPVPVYFKIFIKQAMSFYMLVFPFGWVEQFGWLIIPLLLVIVYVLLGLENLSEELEEPFGSNTALHQPPLHLDKIAENIVKNITLIAGITKGH
jgi:putative membrane protein